MISREKIDKQLNQGKNIKNIKKNNLAEIAYTSKRDHRMKQHNQKI